ncbi:MAG: hypothetical protein ACYTEW_25765 [Planctomycetota bacterium]|jgi:hypothetical protein
MDSEKVQVAAVPHGLSSVTVRLIERMKSGKPGDFASDEDLSSIAGKSTAVTGDGYSNLRTAQKRVSQDYGVEWERERGAAGLRCCTSADIAADTHKNVRRVRRFTRRALQKANNADLQILDDVEKQRLLTNAAQLGAMAVMAETNTEKKLLARQVNSTPDAAKLLEAFAKNGETK